MISWAQRWRREAVRWADNGVELLFPPRCAWCRAEETLQPNGLCAGCVRAFVAGPERCFRCGAAGRGAADAGCATCHGRKPAWDGILVLGGYGDELRDAVLRVKRPAHEDVVGALATLFVDRHREVLDSASLDTIAPVPMHWWRRTFRGTSAADDIARAVARRLGLPVTPALVRCRATRMQNELPPEERGANVAGAFRVRAAVAGRRVLLVDDVVTTGSTLAACSRALQAAGAAGVVVAALAKADRWGFESDQDAHP